MTKTEENKVRCTRAKITARILAGVSVMLIVVSFFTPPAFIIDSSVFVAVGELMGWGALFYAWEATDRGIDAKWTHGGTTIELNNPDDKK